MSDELRLAILLLALVLNVIALIACIRTHVYLTRMQKELEEEHERLCAELYD